MLTYHMYIVGSGSVGKSRLVERYTKGTYQCGHKGKQTEYTQRLWELPDGTRVKIIIADCGCGTKPSYVSYICARAHAVIACYDTTNRESFENAVEIARELKADEKINAVVMVVGLKNDKKHHCQVAGSEAKSFSDSLGIFFRECSAKENVGVNEVFAKVLMELHKTDGFYLLESVEECAERVVPPSIISENNDEENTPSPSPPLPSLTEQSLPTQDQEPLPSTTTKGQQSSP